MNAVPKLSVVDAARSVDPTDDPVPDDPVPNDSVPNDPVPNDSVPNDSVPNDSATDRLLIDAWIQVRDGDAMALLVTRYSGLVMSVCRRQCRTLPDAEDAFQGTFLILARDAGRVRRRESLAGWLHQVAYRTACRARDRSPSMQSLCEEPVDRSGWQAEIADRHRLRALDDELARLPDHYRSAIVHHYYEGQTVRGTAERMNAPENAVRGWLQRARRKLQKRLVRRGISLSVALAVASGARSASAALSQPASAELLEQTIGLASQPDAAVPTSLEPLLLSESPMFFSTTVLGTFLGTIVATAGVLTLGLAGLLVAPLASPQTGGGQQSVVQVPAGPENPGQTTAPAEPSNVRADQVRSTDSPPDDKPAGQDPLGRPEGFDTSAPANPKAKSNQWVGPHPEVYAAIEEKLQMKLQVATGEAPLDDMVRNIASAVDLPIVIDSFALEEIGLSPDVPVSTKVSGISVESTLNLMLADVELTYTIDNEVLQITTKEADESQHLLTRIYWADQSGLSASTPNADLIQMMVDPDTWEILGGTAVMTVLTGSDQSKSGFAVSAPYRTHRKIEQLLQTIRDGAGGSVQADFPELGPGAMNDTISAGDMGPIDEGGVF